MQDDANKIKRIELPPLWGPRFFALDPRAATNRHSGVDVLSRARRMNSQLALPSAGSQRKC